MNEIETEAREMTAEAGLDSRPAPALRRGWLARLGGERTPAKIVEPGLAGAPTARRRPSAYLLSLLVCVVAPALAAALYFAFVASDQFVVETRFAVHTMASEPVSSASTSNKATTTASLMGGLSAASGDSYLVAAFVRSRACLDEVSKTVDVRAVFRRPEADFVARLKADASPEALTTYWRSMVTSYVDPPSGIVTVTVTTFRRDDALALANAILAAAERMANNLSARARADVMKLADAEVESAQARVIASLSDLRDFREQAGFIDPRTQAESVSHVLETLIAQRVKLETEYQASLRSLSPEAPTLQTLKNRLDQLDVAIAAEKAKLTSQSSDPAALANQLPRYEQLLMRNLFADKLYGLAADGLERARLRAEAQAIYVDVFVPPSEPQEALYPERIASSTLIALALLVLWGIGALTAAIVEDHKL